MDGPASKGCRLRHVRPATGNSAKERFHLVLEPRPLEGCAASTAAETLSLSDGDNVVEMMSSPRGDVGVGLDLPQDSNSQDVVYEKQVRLRTTNTPRNSVLLMAYADVRVRGPQSPSSPSPRRQRPSPARARPIPGKTPWSPSSITARTSPSPPKAARASPAKSPRGFGARRIPAGAQLYLRVGDTLDLGLGKGIRCRYTFTLRLASSAAPQADGVGQLGARQPGVSAKTCAPSSLGAGGAGGSFDDRFSGTKRRLEDVFPDVPKAGVAAGAGVSRSVSGIGGREEDDGVQVLPTPILAVKIEDDDDGDRDAASTAAVAPAVTSHKRRTRTNGGSTGRSTPFAPSEVVDLCDSDDHAIGVGMSYDQPLDLCYSDHSDYEGATIKPLVFAGAPAAVTFLRPLPALSAPSGGGGDRSSPEKPAKGSSVPPPRGFSQLGEQKLSTGADTPARGGTSGGTQNSQASSKPPAARVTVKGGCSSRDGTSATIGKGLAKVEITTSAQAETLWPFPPLAVSPTPPKGEKEGNVKALHPLFPRTSVAPSPHAYVCGDGAAGSPTMTSVATLPDQSKPTAARPRTRMNNFVRLTLKLFVKQYPEATVPIMKELVSCGTALPGSLCDVIVSSLLESRCRVRNECLRLQLRAMLDVDPNIWSPPQDNAPLWLETLMCGVLMEVGSDSAKHRDHSPSDAVLGGHAVVLKVVVDYLAAGRRCGGGQARERTMQFFALPKAQGRGRTKLTPVQLSQNLALHAVTTSADWAVRVWGSEATTVGDGVAGEGMRGAKMSQRRLRRQESPALAQARLLTANLLAEVVETCDLPADKACVGIVDRMKSSSGSLTAACAAGGAAEAKRGLGAAARGGLVRALLGRPFCAELSRALLADLSNCSGIFSGQGMGEIGRLEALLSRMLRRAEGGPDADALLL